jgi:peptidoglycan hydrolase-like protein with peptidoglycan-binding domain
MPVLRVGSSGPDVTMLQEQLNTFRAEVGLDPIGADGDFGGGTKSALQSFQKLHGLEANGVANQETWSVLLGETAPTPPTPRPGSMEAKVLVHREAILKIADETGVPAPIIAGIIAKESAGKADAVGSTGDYGLMQINKRYNQDFVNNQDWSDPETNIRYGTEKFAAKIRSFDGNIDNAVASYNAGNRGVREGLAEGRTLDQITFAPNYVRDILAYARDIGPHLR